MNFWKINEICDEYASFYSRCRNCKTMLSEADETYADSIFENDENGIEKKKWYVI